MHQEGAIGDRVRGGPILGKNCIGTFKKNAKFFGVENEKGLKKNNKK